MAPTEPTRTAETVGGLRPAAASGEDSGAACQVAERFWTAHSMCSCCLDESGGASNCSTGHNTGGRTGDRMVALLCEEARTQVGPEAVAGDSGRRWGSPLRPYL